MTTREQVREVIVEELGALPVKVTDGAHLILDLGADSLDTVELVMAIEEEFGIEIYDEEAEEMDGTVGALAALVERKVGGS